MMLSNSNTLMSAVGNLVLQAFYFLLVSSTALISLNADADISKIEISSYLTNQEIAGKPGSKKMLDFACSDRIYAVLSVEGLLQNTSQKKQKYSFVVEWYDPSGKQVERTEFDFYGSRQNRLWSWLQLDAPTGAFLGRMFDPAFGMEEFIGEWQVKLLLDGDTVANYKFNVLC